MHSELAFEMQVTSLDASELQLAVVSYSDVVKQTSGLFLPYSSSFAAHALTICLSFTVLPQEPSTCSRTGLKTCCAALLSISLSVYIEMYVNTWSLAVVM